MRLNKYLATCGIASRRGADAMIEAGRVTVNGETARPGLDVAPGDDVLVDGRPVRPAQQKRYVLLNKPSGYVSTCSDEKGRPTVLSLIKSDVRLYPVGRLDYDTEGLIILTNDGDLANRIAHPRYKLQKEYYAEVEGLVTRDHMAALKQGVTLDDGFKTSPAKVQLVASGRISRVYVTIGEGKNRQVRRMFEALGLKVLYLMRTRIGEIKLNDDLRLGEYRELTAEEVDYLRSL